MRMQAVRGTSDILPQEVWKWRFLEDKARKIFGLYGYEEMRTPIFERTELFIRTVGETSDIVEKQMYIIPDEKGAGLALRPEATAPVVRSFLEHSLDQEDRLHKFYYIGPMFRHERPQAGRLRQFHQIGVEALGSYHPALEAEVLDLLKGLFEEMGLKNPLFKINSVGCLDCKTKYGQGLRESLKVHFQTLCADCQRRFDKNVLRVLDCKNPGCQGVLGQIPLLPEVLCLDCKTHFEKVKEFLNELGVSYELAPKLVRGLDYYTRTIFEVTHPSLGAQDAIAAGGRYDHLVDSMGGPQMGAVGFGMGIERIILALKDQWDNAKGGGKPFLYLASLGEEAFRHNFSLQKELRKNGIQCEMDFETKSLKSQLRRANKLEAKFVLIRGDDEVTKGIVKLRDMEKSVEEEIQEDHIIKIVEERCRL